MILLENQVAEKQPKNINSLFYSSLQKENFIYISRYNAPYRLGHLCNRQLVYLQNIEDDAQLPSLQLKKIISIVNFSKVILWILFVKNSSKNYNKQTGKNYFCCDNYQIKVFTVNSTISKIPQEIINQYTVLLIYDKVTIKPLNNAKV